MTTSGRKRAGIGLTAGLVIAGIVGVTSMSASGGVVVGDPPDPTITISLQERSGTITYQPPVGDPVVQDIATSTPCATVSTSGPELLVFTPTASSDPSVQLPRGGLGVESGTNCGDPAGFVSRNQTLTVGLGSFFADESEPGSFTTSIIGAELEILRNGGSSLKVSYAGGSEVISSTTNTFTASVGTLGPFTDIKLEPSGGSPPPQQGVSLQGAVFTLEPPFAFDTALGCSASYSPDGAAAAGEAATTATFTRAENGLTKTTECEDIGVIVEIRDTVVFWDNATTGVDGTPQDVKALIEIEWAGVLAAEANSQTTEINYDGDEEGPFFEAQWCESFEQTTDENGKITLTALRPQGPIDIEDGTPVIGTVPWCLVSSNDVLGADGFVVRTTVFYGAGDPVGRWS